MDADFDSVFTLRLRLRAAQNEITSLRSGQAYVRMAQNYQRQLRMQDQEIIRLRKELGTANATVVTMRHHWTEVLDDISKEASRSLRRKDKEIENLKKRIWEVEAQRDNALDKLQAEREEKYQALTELEEEKGKNRKLQAQIKRDFETSSKPSSEKQVHKKIENNREKTGRKPGGQPGHKGHPRKQLDATEKPVMLQPPEEITKDPDYYRTGKLITRKLVEIQLEVIVREYQAEEYRRHSNGSRYHAPFPEGICNEINYGSSVKAFAFCLNNYCNVPIQKVSEFLSDLTDERVRLSAGFINGLSKEFSAKTKKERADLFSKLMASDKMHTDATVGRVNGKGKSVFVCTNGKSTMYFFRDQKGHKGVAGTPVELFAGTLIHDHDPTFYHYANAHQECLAHVLRYLKDSMQNEPDLEWNKRMHDFLRKIIHEHKQADRRLPENRIRKIEKEYDEILEQAKREYEYDPPSDYYRNGYNLQKRLREYKENHLLFLRDPELEWTNNRSERLLRRYKRKQKSAVTFRSQRTAEEYCDALSIIESGKSSGTTAYQTVKIRFS